MTTGLSLFDVTGAEGPPPGTFLATVPGEKVVCHAVALPRKAAIPTRRAIAERQVQDLLSEPMEALELHQIKAGRQVAPWSRVAAWDAELATRARARLVDFGARCKALVPDYFALPWEDDAWVMQAEGPRLVVRLDVGRGFAAHHEVAIALLRLESRPPARIVLYGAPSAEVHDDLAKMGAELVPKAETAPPSPTPVPWGYKGFPLDLREDRAATVARLTSGLWRWAAIMVLALVGGSAVTAAQLAELAQAREARALAMAAVTGLARETFLPTGPILDVRAQVGRVLASLESASEATETVPTEMLALLRQTGPVLLEAGAELRSVRIGAAPAAGQAALEVTLDAASFEALDALVAALRAAGFEVEVPQSAVIETGATRARLLFRAG